MTEESSVGEQQPTDQNPELKQNKHAGIAFAHPIEEEFARLLDYYGLRWEYEPRTFDLRWDEQGSVTQAFTPDFYLVDQDIYVELTTARPKLITKKNRKIRRMEKLYPDVSVQLWKRSDLRNLMLRFGMDDQAAGIMGTDAQEKKNG
ncbi:MAG: hypothetical protein R3293_22020 [Candidatus Promineifilaceae bacterium]|nr:hypothetical protein [Candidatus Promineifilaceae bacterium]